MEGNCDCAVFVVGLAGVGVERGVGEFVDLLIVHGEEDLAGLYGGGEVSLGCDVGAAARDRDLAAVWNVELCCVVGVDF